MSSESPLSGGIACWVTAALFLLGFVVLAVKLEHVQLDDTADLREEFVQQSVRRVRTAGERGRILDAKGRVLADNRPSVAIAVLPSVFSTRAYRSVAISNAIETAVVRAGAILGLEPKLTPAAIGRHLRASLARPLVVWDDIDAVTLARFAEHEGELPGFTLEESERRVYPQGSRAAHVLGYVGCDRATMAREDGRIAYAEFEWRGNEGLERYYDRFLRGVPGEREVTVDASGFSRDEDIVAKPTRGFDLRLTIDLDLQTVAEDQLAGCRGACVVLDPRNGAVLALASAPTFDSNALLPVFDPNRLRPVLSAARYDAYALDPEKPLLNRALAGGYAPGSTFKPVTALAALSAGADPSMMYECTGVFTLGGFRLHCARTWGHGPLDVRHALKESCNAFFCHLGMETGTNALIAAAHAFGLGSSTGIDFPVELRGVVPDGAWKYNTYHERWYPGDLAQMSIGQGMLLVTPLQMARVIGALGTGRLVTPHLKQGLESPSVPLPFSTRDLTVVREGLRMVVDGGSGKRGGAGVDAYVIGKTGTAEVGRGETRRKNTWFTAYATGTAASRPDARDRAVAVAMVIENGESGGGTTAPKVAEVLKAVFNGEAAHVE